jgi:hypothetical protein
MTKSKQNIYILTESLLNGSVTSLIITTGIKAHTYDEAVAKLNGILKKNIINKGFTIEITQDDDECVSYRFFQNGSTLCGIMENRVLNVV